jgi:hypothetical protein
MNNKKILYIAIAAIVVIAAVVLSVVFLGGNNTNNGTTNNGEQTTPDYANSVELLNKIWNTIPENSDEFPKYAEDPEYGRSYYFVGGDMTMNEETWEPIVVYNGAGSVSLTEEMLYNHYFPMDMISSVEEAASIYSQMGYGLFTVAAYRVTNANDIATIAAKIEEGVQNEFWMCCIPTRVVLVQAGNYLIAMYGQDAVEYFLNVTLDTIDGAKVLIDNPISR